MALTLVLGAMAIPGITAGLDRSRAGIAARYVSAQMALARTQAVTRSASVALRFGAVDTGYEFDTFVDGNANGVRARDIEAGLDRRISTAQRLRDQFPTVTIDVRPEVGVGSDPIRIGNSALLVFTPRGTATPGSIYVLGRDGTQFVVRIVGATARTRVQRYNRTRRTWEDA
jgi:Tfp pilus assembly protein FimT